jgi:hypothetical protein
MLKLFLIKIIVEKKKGIERKGERKKKKGVVQELFS